MTHMWPQHRTLYSISDWFNHIFLAVFLSFLQLNFSFFHMFHAGTVLQFSCREAEGKFTHRTLTLKMLAIGSDVDKTLFILKCWKCTETPDAFWMVMVLLLAAGCCCWFCCFIGVMEIHMRLGHRALTLKVYVYIHQAARYDRSADG